MNRTPEPSDTPVQQALPELLARYLQHRVEAYASGLGYADTADVVPHEAVPVQPVDPRLAWDEALTVLHHFQPKLDTRCLKAPTDWPAMVAGHEPVAALPFCVGNFPQLVRHLQPLLHAPDLTAIHKPAAPAPSVPLLLDWAEQMLHTQRHSQTLLVAGVLRLARQYDRAAELLQRDRKKVPAEWIGAWANEEAALAWHRGKADEAAALWAKQTTSTPVLFNRGVAALFLGKADDARKCLRQAAEQLPEENAWHHLGRVYLALAEMRG